MGRTLMMIGAVLLLAGGVLWLVERFLPGLGRPPGDIVIRRGNFTFFFPIMTSLLLSLVLTLLLRLLKK